MPAILLTATKWGACILRHYILILELHLNEIK